MTRARSSPTAWRAISSSALPAKAPSSNEVAEFLTTYAGTRVRLVTATPAAPWLGGVGRGLAIETIAPEEVFTLRQGKQRQIDTLDGRFRVRPLGPALPLYALAPSSAVNVARAVLGRFAKDAVYDRWLRTQQEALLANAVCARDDVPTTGDIDSRPGRRSSVPDTGRLLRCVLPFVLALAFAGNATAGAIIDRTATALQSNPVYVDPSAEKSITPAEAERLRTEIETKGHGPIYIAVLPNAALDEAGGDAVGVANELHRQLGNPGVYAVVAGGHFRALSSDLDEGKAGELARQAFSAHGNDGIAATLVDFVDRVGAERSGKGERGQVVRQDRPLPDPADRRHPLLRLSKAEGATCRLGSIPRGA